MLACNQSRIQRSAALAILLGASLLTLACGCANVAEQQEGQQGQMTFDSPEYAVEALAAAARKSHTAELQAIFGPEGQEILSSGDAVADRRNREVFLIALDQRWRLEEPDKNRRELVIGNEDWPFPVPLVKDGDGWRFDTEAGKAEVLARRIGRNELAAIGVCRTYVIAQKEYASQGHDGKPAGVFAQKVRSTPGRQDGLFWPTTGPSDKPSPLGDLAAQAAAEGYSADRKGLIPFRGYFFRILTHQGPAAPGGAKSYLVNDDMKEGFALVAYPADYGNSGIMTFIVNQDGVVHEADLGQDTSKIAGAITAYDPDGRFRKVE